MPTPSVVRVTEVSASALVGALRAGEVSCEEVVERHLERTEEVDAVLHAVAVDLAARARNEAREADRCRRRGERVGELHGLPVTVKDQFDVAGSPTSFGVTRLTEQPVERDGPTVAALRAAGAIVTAKSSVPQGLGVYETVNEVVGRTVNPWDTGRTPGGSSGGEAALVASGASALGLGADFGGSLRVPAAWCGLVTLKPTARRLPLDRAPVRTASGWEGIVGQPGPLARNVTDVAIGLRVLVEANVARPTATTPPVPWRDPAHVDPSGLRVAVLEEVDGYRPAPAVRRALRLAAAALREAGTSVEVWRDPPDTSRGGELFLRMLSADGFSFAREVIGDDAPHAIVAGDLRLTELPRPVLRLLAAGMRGTRQHRTARLLRSIERVDAAGLMGLLGDRAAYEATFLAAMAVDGYDLVLCPAVPLPAVPHDATPRIPDAFVSATLFNVLGVPAGVVPVTRVLPGEESDRSVGPERSQRAARAAERGSSGLPIGVQIAGRHWREDQVLAAMSAIETHLATDADVPRTPVVPTGSPS